MSGKCLGKQIGYGSFAFPGATNPGKHIEQVIAPDGSVPVHEKQSRANATTNDGLAKVRSKILELTESGQIGYVRT